MSAYIFAVGGKKGAKTGQIEAMVRRGAYSTALKTLAILPFEATLADYLTMKEGDEVYFFADRRIYGIGRLVKRGVDCKYANFPGACCRLPYDYADIKNALLYDDGRFSNRMRWMCTFEPSPCFFKDGLDMDEILNYKPHCFRSVRAFWKRTFIKLDDEESRALREYFLIRLGDEILDEAKHFTYEGSVHGKIREIKNFDDYLISPRDIVLSCQDAKGGLKHEMAIEASLIDTLIRGGCSDLGKWDEVSHQVIASPFKPIDYMDKIDVLATKYIKGSDVVGKYLVAELKKGKADNKTVTQLMEYVDWICETRAYGNYGVISACIIAKEYGHKLLRQIEQDINRTYLLGSHPAFTKQWSAVTFLKYDVTAEGELLFSKVWPCLGVAEGE